MKSFRNIADALRCNAVGYLMVTVLPVVMWHGIPAQAATHLAGEISGVIKHDYSPYYIDNDIIVPKDKKCVIEPGCVFLFKEFTGIKVFGRIEVNGTAENQVIFTSERDRTYNRDTVLLNDSVPQAAPFDWNGMDVLEQSIGSVVSNASFRYMVNGIYSRTKLIIVDRCYFDFTGTIPLRVEDKIFDPTPGTPVSFDGTALAGGTFIPSTGGAGTDKPFLQRHKKGIRIGCITLGTAGAVAGLTYGCLAIADYHTANSGIRVGEDPKSDWTAADKRYHQRLQYMIGALSMGTFGGIGYLLTLNIR